MNQIVKENSTGNNTIKKSRGFIFFVGFLLLAASSYIYSFQNLWVTSICAVVGISFILIAMYAKKKIIYLMEKLTTGWP